MMRSLLSHFELLLSRIVILHVLFFAGGTNSLFAQTSIGPMIGYEFSSFISYVHSPYLYSYEDPLDIHSIVYGVKVDHHVSDNNFLSLQGNFSRKDFTISTIEFIPVDSAVMESYRFSLSYKYKANNFFFSLGPYADLLRNNRTYQTESNFLNTTLPDFEEYGVLTSVGYEYKKISLELFSYIGISQIKEEMFSLNHKPFFSIGASISYLFELNFKSNGKKVMCPKV